MYLALYIKVIVNADTVILFMTLWPLAVPSISKSSVFSRNYEAFAMKCLPHTK